MSMFEYLLRCCVCSYQSDVYPYRFKDISPESSEGILPAWDRKQSEFLEYTIQVSRENRIDFYQDKSGKQEQDYFLALAQNASKDNLTVGVPILDQEGELSVIPLPQCPRCGGDVKAVWASRVPKSKKHTLTLDELIRHVVKKEQQSLHLTLPESVSIQARVSGEKAIQLRIVGDNLDSVETVVQLVEKKLADFDIAMKHRRAGKATYYLEEILTRPTSS